MSFDKHNQENCERKSDKNLKKKFKEKWDSLKDYYDEWLISNIKK